MGNYHHISSILIRKSKKQQGPNKSNSIYPLYQNNGDKSFSESYNFENILESAYKWNDYSPSIGKNWNKLMSIYEAVGELGTSQQLHEMTCVINNNIIPYIDSPSMMKSDLCRRLSCTESDDMKSCIGSMIETITESIECDRVLKNIDTISKRFNIVKVAQPNIFYEDAITESIYNICELIDTYNMDLKNKFCVACECALYSAYSNLDPISEDINRVSDVTVLENVTDYFMINYGRNQIENFIDLIESAAKSDIFIGEQLTPYISHLRKVNGNQYTEEMVYESVNRGYQEKLNEEANRKYRDETILGLAEDLDQYDAIRRSAESMVFKEDFQSPEERVKEFITKIKMLPMQSMSALKAAITAILVPCRAEDIGKGTHNALSIIFYAICTLGWFSVGGPLGGLFGSVVSYIVAKASQKAYLKDAITEWREHRYSVARKIKESTDPEKKRRMEAYMAQVDVTISNLETRYDSMRERTAEEIAKQTDRRMEDPENSAHYRSSQVDPDGKITPTSNLYDKDHEDHKEEDKNDYKKDAPSKIDDDNDFEDDEYDDDGNPKKKDND